MKYFNRISKMIMCLLSSWYLTNVVAQRTLTTLIQFVFVFFYFLIISAFTLFYYENFLKKKIGKDFIKIIILSGIVTLFTVVLLGDRVVIKQYKQNIITIQSSENKNNKSNGNELWITSINVDSNNISLLNIPLTNGWEYKKDSNAIFANAANKIDPLVVNLPKAKKINITFVKHKWSGIVNISNGKSVITKDLYDPSGSTYNYKIRGEALNVTLSMKVLLYISFFILEFSITFIGIIILLKSKKTRGNYEEN